MRTVDGPDEWAAELKENEQAVLQCIRNEENPVALIKTRGMAQETYEMYVNLILLNNRIKRAQGQSKDEAIRRHFHELSHATPRPASRVATH